MKKRILHILSSNELAGAENVAINIINNLSNTYECAYASPEGGIKEILKVSGIHYLPLEKFNVLQIKRAIDLWKPDIIHAHDFKATVKCLAASFFIPVVSHIHQNPKWLKQVNPYSILFFLACFKIKQIVVVSPGIKKSTFLSTFFKRKTTVIKNIVDIKQIKEKSDRTLEEAYDIAFIGRLNRVKNPLRFISIIEKVKDVIPNLRVVMLGEGPLETECKEYIKKNDLEDIIDLKGFLPNPYPLLSRSKLLVMTSLSEGLPIVAIEALALEKPIIVPRLDGMEYIVDKSCGYICNNEDEFVSRIIYLLNSEQTYMDMSIAAAKQAAELCDMNLYRRNLDQVYQSVIY